ncbi:unnamed protein product, partial [Laminaria digitata]
GSWRFEELAAAIPGHRPPAESLHQHSSQQQQQQQVSGGDALGNIGDAVGGGSRRVGVVAAHQHSSRGQHSSRDQQQQSQQ